MTKSSFTISSGQQFELFTTTAEVVAKENLKSFNFSQSGGGGYVGQHGGYVAAPRIQVHENNTDRYWLRDEQGNEFNLDLTNINLPVREGHRLRQFFLSTTGTDLTRRVGIKNENTGQCLELASNSSALVQGHKNWKSGIVLNLCWLFFCCVLGAFFYVRFVADPKSVQVEQDPHFVCMGQMKATPMKAKGITMLQYRATLDAAIAENRERYKACRKELADKLKRDRAAELQAKGPAFVALRDLQRKNFPDVVAALGFWSGASLLLCSLLRLLSRHTYSERKKTETAARTRTVVLAEG